MLVYLITTESLTIVKTKALFLHKMNIFEKFLSQS